MSNLVEDVLAFLDVETTGLVPGRDEVCEIATIITDLSLKEIDRIVMKVKLTHPERMSPEAAAKNGYDPVVWAKEARPFVEWKMWLRKHTPRPRVAIPVGHNVGFDRDIIYEYYYKPGKEFLPLSYHKFDTVGIPLMLKVAGLLDVPNFRLETVKEAIGIKSVGHRAMADCEAAKALFEKMLFMLKASAVPVIERKPMTQGFGMSMGAEAIPVEPDAKPAAAPDSFL